MACLSDQAIDALERLELIPPGCSFVRVYGEPLDWRVEYGTEQARACNKIARDPHPPAEVLRAWQDWLIEAGILSEDCAKADLIFKRGEPAKVIATNYLSRRFLAALLAAEAKL